MLEKMREIIAEQLNCDEGEINVDKTPLKLEYSVEIPAEELQELTTVGAVIDYLKNKGVEE
mgnify:CR=1 FL=1